MKTLKFDIMYTYFLNYVNICHVVHGKYFFHFHINLLSYTYFLTLTNILLDTFLHFRIYVFFVFVY